MESADRTYSVSWKAPDGSVTTCTGLTPRIAFARLWAAWKASGEITVTAVEPEWVAKANVTAEWPYSIEPPDCQEGLCVVNDVTGFKCGACTLWIEENAALLAGGA